MQLLKTLGEHARSSAGDTTSDTSRLSDERWPRVKGIFHAALERPAAERAAFTREACQGDNKLEAIVESLLSSDRDASEFLEAPAVARVGLPLDTTATLTKGDRLGAYEVVTLLGAGGMGEVYRARDHRLARDVAIKVLPADVMHDAVHRKWLELEARAAAALDHPNICPIFDVGEQDGRAWIAMQYVEGETLAERLRHGPLKMSAALDVATQIASALSAAHARGIVHRDVKPENVMVTATGQAKVLDFGLAKIATKPGPETVHSRQSAVHSRRLGTLPYMSPEQVRGESLDARTDVFSLNVVLYEMVTGHRPFRGEKEEDITAGILSVIPPPVSSLNPTLDPRLDRITRRGLEKDRTVRYQTMSDWAADIDDIKRSLEAVSRPRDARAWVAGGALAAIVVGLIAASLWWSSRQQATRTSSGPFDYVQLTNFPDSVLSPALSPDGRLLAFVRGGQAGGGQDLYLKELPDGQPRRLTDDGGIKDAPTFTPDGSRIAYQRGLTGPIFTVSVAGGTSSRFMSNAAGLHWIGPEELLFSRMKRAPNMGVVTASSKSSANVRDIYVPPSSTGMAHFSERSPDGSQVLVVEMERSGWLPCRLVPFDGSSTGRRVGPAPAECTAAGWSPDGRWMYFLAAVNGQSHLWRQRFPDGAPEQLTFGPNQERGTMAVDPDGKSLIAAVGATQSTVWYHDERGERSISIEGYAYRPLVSPDGREVFYLVRRTAETAAFVIGELWATDLASGRNERVLPGFLIRSYHLSADGKLIVFDSVDESGQSGVWLATLDGKERPRRLTTERVVYDLRPFIGASGDVYFMQPRNGVADLYRMRQDGSGRQRLAEDIDFLVNISPDEQWAVVWSFLRTRLIPLAGGSPRGLCRCGIGPIIPGPPGVGWSRDGTSIFVDISSHVDTVGDRDGTLVIPSENLGRWPGNSVPSMADFVRLSGARRMSVSGVAPGQTAERYAFSRRTEQSNLYRIRLP